MVFNAGNAGFLLAFLLSAAVQYNDPDPLRWIAVYSAAAALCAARYIIVVPRWAPAVLIAVCVGWIALLLPQVVGKVSPGEVFASITMQTRAVEEAREIGGLLLVALWSTVLMLNVRSDTLA